MFSGLIETNWLFFHEYSFRHYLLNSIVGFIPNSLQHLFSSVTIFRFSAIFMCNSRRNRYMKKNRFSFIACAAAHFFVTHFASFSRFSFNCDSERNVNAVIWYLSFRCKWNYMFFSWSDTGVDFTSSHRRSTSTFFNVTFPHTIQFSFSCLPTDRLLGWGNESFASGIKISPMQIKH